MFEERRGYHTYSTCKSASQTKKYKLKSTNAAPPKDTKCILCRCLRRLRPLTPDHNTPNIYVSFMSKDDRCKKTELKDSLTKPNGRV